MSQLKSTFEYDIKVSFDDRKKEVDRIKEKHPGKIPVIVEKSQDSKLVLSEEFKYKFLVQPDHTISNFMVELRKRLNLQPDQALFLFINNSVPPTGSSMGEIYEKNKDTDGFLKIHFCEETIMG